MAADLVVLVVLDGWGCAPRGPGNGVELATTPSFDRLWRAYPHGTLDASGAAVGVPAGQMGNSEVGHLTIGAGRIVEQDLVRINNAIDRGELDDNEAIVGAFDRAARRGGDVHLVGLVSYGGVHSHVGHLRALLELGRRRGQADRVVVHAVTDGRDVSPHAARSDLAELAAEGAPIATVLGRYYAMDRDRRWERTERALEALVDGRAPVAPSVLAAIEESYERGITDEFVEPVLVADLAGRRIAPRDTVISFNFRPDRARQLAARLVEGGADLTTMTHYADDLGRPVAFAERTIDHTLSEVIARRGLAQLHAAETEKYAHVTYFLNGGREEPWPGEERILVPSPAEVGTYDERPGMSAAALAAEFSARLRTGAYALAIVNFANPDMVGHTGKIPAVVQAVEAADRGLGQVIEAVESVGGTAVVFADHGNAEQMLEDDGVSPHTAHTTNSVPVIVTAAAATLREGGGLRDVAPTALGLLEQPVPAEMTGRSLVDR